MQACVIVEALRTPIGRFKGALGRMSAVELGTSVGRAILSMLDFNKQDVDEVIMGTVLSANQGQAPARQIAIKMGLSESCPATTVNKVCGSGMKSVMMAYDQIRLGQGNCYFAGGMESMSNAPFLMTKAREGLKFGELPKDLVSPVVDHILQDGLLDASTKPKSLMGAHADLTAKKYNITRAQKDEYALRSLERAQKARAENRLQREIVPLLLKTPTQEIELDYDEELDFARPEKIPTLKPAFMEEGTVTAGNASSLADGAAMLLVTSEEYAKQHNLPIRARIKGASQSAGAPADFTAAPVQSIAKLMHSLSWTVSDVDLFEINEAFASVPLIAAQELGIDHRILNVNGGACAIGHPLAASSARVIVTLLNALEQRSLKRGIASVCIGGGESTSVAIEL
ncbi:MAG: acetyl-CoA C-acyltransferase [Rickettsiales bacterium]|mgnify:CR=1 FL=1|nr:acetyl-CoA C-acyltransferase [Rickettsiales bacterium]|tara:strand:- start:4613 stop:5809 length:1197 start_codon:yes stop_codon:yes gene_type:complete